MAHIGVASHSPVCRFFTAPLNTQESSRDWIVGSPGAAATCAASMKLWMPNPTVCAWPANSAPTNSVGIFRVTSSRPTCASSRAMSEGFWHRMPSSRKGVVRASSDTKETPPTWASSSS